MLSGYMRVEGSLISRWEFVQCTVFIFFFVIIAVRAQIQTNAWRWLEVLLKKLKAS